jgi:DNA-binding beta-propeller fold protein YncE
MAAFIRRALNLGIEGRLTLVRAIDASTYPSYDPTGLVYRAETNQLILFDAPADEQPGFTGTNAFILTLTGDLVYEWNTLAYSAEPAGSAYDPSTDELYISDDDLGVVFVVNPGGDNVLGTTDDAARSFNVSVLGSDDPEGLALDSNTGNLYVINGTDSDSPEIFRLSPGTNGVLDGIPPAGDDTAISIDVETLGLTDPEGGTFDAINDSLLVVDRGTPGTVFELDPDGGLIQSFGISTTGADLAGIELAPASGNSGSRSLYLVDRGEEGVADGTVFEFRYD